MDALIDAHLHFSCRLCFRDLESYCARMGILGLGLVSLPSLTRINFNPELFLGKRLLPGLAYAFASFDYGPALRPLPGQTLDLVGQVEKLKGLGADGLKLFVGKPDFQKRLGLAIDDRFHAPALDRAGELGLPVVAHMADVKSFWTFGAPPAQKAAGWDYSGGGFLSFETLQEQARAVLGRHPGTIFIFPHLLFLAQDLERLAGLLEAHANAFLDLSPGNYFYAELSRKRRRALSFFDRFRDRILFGSDGFWFSERFFPSLPMSLEANLERAGRLIRFLSGAESFPDPFARDRPKPHAIRGLGLKPEILEPLCHGNFRRLFPRPPRPLDMEALDAYLDDFLEEMARRDAPQEEIEEVRAGQRQLREEAV